MNIYDYVLENKDKKIDEITEIDAMILSRLAYIHIENILDKIPLTICELSLYLEDIKTNSHDKKLVNLLKDTSRYKDLVIKRCENILDKEKEEQFTAITISLPDNNIFISFRGTNRSIIGYKEDLNMSFMTIPSQISGVKYINEEKEKGHIYLGGHSKGGNIAMYTGANANFIKRMRIKKIYNFDGPGFLEINDNIKKIEKKIINYFPENSFVGTLMYNDSKKEFVKVMHDGIEIHNLYYWKIIDNKLERGVQSKNSISFHENCLNVLTNISEEKRKIIIDYLYKLILEGEIKNIKELKFDDVTKLINNAPKLSKSDKNILSNFMKSFMKCLLPTIKKV